MYTAEIDFQTEKELIHLKHGKFATSEEAVAFATAFVKPYTEKCMIADGEWKVFDPEHLYTLPERHYTIHSIRSLREDGMTSSLKRKA